MSAEVPALLLVARHAGEALECFGGNGYVEESVMPRPYRQQPLLSIWEGSGNVIALDVLRAIRRELAAQRAERRHCGLPPYCSSGRAES